MQDEAAAIGDGGLGGSWRATPADDSSRRVYQDPDFDDSGWAAVVVPGHWRDSPEFAAQDGPVLYRKRFDAGRPACEWDRPRSWLTLEGVFYTADVWLDGTYVGDTEGYFFPHSFDVTDLIDDRDEHLLALEVACTPQQETRKRNLTGWFQSPEFGDTDWNPGGIWRSVHVDRTGPVRIRHMRVLCREASHQTATVFIRAVLDTTDARDVDVRTTIRQHQDREVVVDSTYSQPLAVGENRLEWTVTVADPELWWPAALGDQPLYEVDVEVSSEEHVSDSRVTRTGLRSIELQNWLCSVNGERLFLKGAVQGPNRRALARATAQELVRDVDLALEAGLDLLRLRTHVSVPALYEAADERGLLIWQDLPLYRGYARSVRNQARRQAREAVDLLGHHPSVAIWCGHDEPFAIDTTGPSSHDGRSRRRTVARALAGTVAPTWNKTVLDHSVRSVLNRSDGTRPVIAHSGVLPHPPRLDGTDTHLWLGWHFGDERDLGRLARLWPRLARFVTGSGTQSVPVEASFLGPGDWPDLDWKLAEEKYSLQRCAMDAHVPAHEHGSFESWRDATQRYQAHLVHQQILTLRRLKYQPCGGFAVVSFADPEPSVSPSLLDHDRNEKPALDALREACRPVVIAADRLPTSLVAGEEVALEIHVVSDLRADEGNLIARARLEWRHAPGADIAGPWEWWGEAAADSCVRVGRMSFRVPDPPTGTAPPGAAVLRVVCELWRHGGDSPIATTWDEAPVDSGT